MGFDYHSIGRPAVKAAVTLGSGEPYAMLVDVPDAVASGSGRVVCAV